MLTVACENYNALRNQLADYMTKNHHLNHQQQKPTGGILDINTTDNVSRKRKLAENPTNNNNMDWRNGNSESSSSDEDSCKKPREEHLKPKISRSYVRTEASDSSLVSPKLTHPS